jgi:hypothetical protein
MVEASVPRRSVPVARRDTSAFWGMRAEKIRGHLDI